MIRVLLADDHAVVRAGLKEILTATGDIEVAAEANEDLMNKYLESGKLSVEEIKLGLRLGNERLWSAAAPLLGWHTFASGKVKEGMALLERAWEIADFDGGT